MNSRFRDKKCFQIMDNYLDQFEQDIQEKPINWREIFEKLIFNWKWFVLSVAVALIIGVVYARMQQDVYELKSSILIIDQTHSGQMNEMSVLKQLDAAGVGGTRSYSMVNNEEQVLKSTALMKRVVNRLQLYTSYTHKVWLKTEDLYTSSPLLVSIDSTALSQLKHSLNLKIVPENGELHITVKYLNTEFKTILKSLPGKIQTPAGDISVRVRPGMEFPDETIAVTIADPIKVARGIVMSALTTDVGKYVDVVNLTIHVSNPQEGQDLLNTLADVYNEDASEQNNQSVINTARFIDGRLKLLTSELGEVESQMEKYKQENHLTDIDADAQLYLSATSTLDQQQIEVEIQQHLINYVEEFIGKPANKYALIPNLGLTDVGLVAVIGQYNELLMARNRVAEGSTSHNPALTSLEKQIASTRNAILTSINNSKKGLQISGSDIGKQYSDFKSKIRDIPRQEREYIEIKRQQQVKESLYLFLLQKREEASLNMAVTVPKGRVLDTPDDATVVGPHRTIIMLVFLFAGLLIPAIIIYVVDLMNTSIRNREDVEKLTDIPVITELEYNDSDSMIIDYKTNANSNSELFRLMRAKLQFALDQPVEKTILVTSTLSGEGKTFVSINLSIMLSLAERKVLLVGMDLRNPQLAKHFGIDGKEGISAYLSGQNTDLNKLIQSTKEFNTLDILPAGVIPPNPTELLMKERFDTLMTELKTQYDYIVIDSAPVGAVSDSFLIDRVCDLTLYVCRAGYTDKRNIEFVNRVRDEKTLKHIYFVVNDVDFHSNRYSYYSKYGYGKKYGYGYGHGHGHKK